MPDALEHGGAAQRAAWSRGEAAATSRPGTAVRQDDWVDASPRGTLHVAIIMDGSGRWAEARGRPRLDGHRAGEKVVRTVVAAAPALGIGTLTLFAFSSDNWKRPLGEVNALLGLLRDFLLDFRAEALAHDIRIEVMGRRERLTPGLRAAADAAQSATADRRGLHLRLAIDYSARDAILRAARRLAAECATPIRDGAAPRVAGSAESDAGLASPTVVPTAAWAVERDRLAAHDAFTRALVDDDDGRPAPAVDLLVRTGGEQRLSDFLLWECAYAELYFTKKMWPDFAVPDLRAAVHEFRARERRFGCLPGRRS